MGKKTKKGVIIAVIAALTACAGAVCFFLKKRKRTFYNMTAAILICGLLMGAGMTVYAYGDTEPYTEPGEVIETITGEEITVDIGDFISPDRLPNQLTPPGNLTLVDDFSGEQSLDKQFITVVTRNGNYFYIIIDRAGERENVHFLNLVDEFSLLQILQGEDFVPPPIPSNIIPVIPIEDEPTEDEPEPTATPTPRQNNNTGLLLMLLAIAAAGGGAFWFFKVRKPKLDGGGKKTAKNPLDEFEFDPDEDDMFSESPVDNRQDSGDLEFDSGEPDNHEPDSEAEDDIPDFTYTPDSDTDGGDNFTIDDNTGEETSESEENQ